jgi:predicted O-methyltransferase YrrM
MTQALREAAGEIGFTMSSDDLTGGFLATLASSKPGGRFLELGTGVGVGSAQLLSGMDAASTLLTVERSAEQIELAQKHLGRDPRVTFWLGDGLEFLQQPHVPFDLIFADTWLGKISRPELALDLAPPCGFYITDDMELGWKDKADLKPPTSDYLLEVWTGQRALMELLGTRDDFHHTRLDWSTGLLVCVKKGA